ncbi:MAG: nucleotidyltransferase domain-containing protein [bacterium]|nr:nucleotidyltransferase domain-containing protein [bacterium]
MPAVKGVIAIGSIGSGTAHEGSDLDAVVFLDPLDLYVVPAEAIWYEPDDTFYSIFTSNEDVQRDGLQIDFLRLDWQQWSAPDFDWPEPRKAELSAGWIAFDRDGEIGRLVAARTTYDDQLRLARLDEAITWLDQHLGEDGPQQRWETLPPAIAHDRLHAAYDYLVQGLFAYNRVWRPWRNREMTALLQLPWLPANFETQILTALNSPSQDFAGYMRRAETLNTLFVALLAQVQADGLYGDDPTGDAFIRNHEEPGRAWNMGEWMIEHRKRYPQDQQGTAGENP